jgi:hypothetical protein
MNHKIAIIGGGWLGCHLSSKLKDNNKVSLFDKQNIFTGSSLYNQNRLHKGFHYSRNQPTRKLCQNTFLDFLKDYNHIVDKIENNYYAVPYTKSIIDYQTYKNIFQYDNIDFIESNPPFLSNVEGSLIVDERYINPIKAKSYFENKLKPLFFKKEITSDKLIKISKEYDLVINTTNNMLQPIPEYTYELCLTLVYTKIKNNEFNALTMVDGPFFSIYPYINDKYTVTDVQYTPIYSNTNIQDIENFKMNINNKFILNVKSKIEEKITYYFKDFHKYFTYDHFFTSIKNKKPSESSDRSPTILQESNIITCTTGKIQGIYTLENYIINEIINR